MKGVSINSAKELESVIRERNRTGWSIGDTRVIVQTMPLLIRQNDQIIELLKVIGRRNRRGPSEYNLYIGKCLKNGLTLKKAIENWKYIRGGYNK